MNRLILIKHKTYIAWTNSRTWLKDVGFPLLRTFSPALFFSLSIGLQVEDFSLAFTVFCILAIGTLYIKTTEIELSNLRESVNDLKRESATTIYTQAFKDRYVSTSELKKEDFYEPASMYIPSGMDIPNYSAQALGSDINRSFEEAVEEYSRRLERSSDPFTQFGSDSELVRSTIDQALENIRREQGLSVSLGDLTVNPATMINLPSRRGISREIPRTVLQSYRGPTGRPLTPGEWYNLFRIPGEEGNFTDLWQRAREEQEPEETEHI